MLPHNVLLSRYQYDPLDRLRGAHGAQRFYNKTRLATVIEDKRNTCFFEHDAQPLALQRSGTAADTTLLATDAQASVLSSLPSSANPSVHHYTPYGHRALVSSLPSVPGFNGEQPDPLTGHYLLGQGYRAFNPVLMRFNSPDNLSPFGQGGLNAYAYCAGDPVNRADATGHFWQHLISAWKGFQNRVGLRVPSRQRQSSIASTSSLPFPSISRASSVFSISPTASGSVAPATPPVATVLSGKSAAWTTREVEALQAFNVPPLPRSDSIDLNDLAQIADNVLDERRMGIYLSEDDADLMALRRHFAEGLPQRRSSLPEYDNFAPPDYEWVKKSTARKKRRPLGAIRRAL